MFNNIKISKTELHAILILSAIFALRMSGIFMALPILPIYAASLQGAQEYLIGISIGIYGIMQIIFQLPFGIISDKIGRKSVIIIGLIIFFIGSEIVAIAHTIQDLIIGRALQGSGAIGSVLIVLLLESVQENNRVQAMALMGISFGITFTSSIIIGPIIVKIFGLSGLFQIITIIAGAAIILTYLMIPSTTTRYHSPYNNMDLQDILNNIKYIITNVKLLKLNFNNFCLHTILVLNFMVWPRIITDLGYHYNTHYKIYATVIIISVLFVLPCIFHSHKQNNRKKILFFAINTLFLSELIMIIFIKNSWLFLLGIQIFFIAFNLIESILPDFISKNSPIQYKGTSMSIYAINQFFGIGIGGILGGMLLEIAGTWVILFCAIIIAISNIIINNKIT